MKRAVWSVILAAFVVVNGAAQTPPNPDRYAGRSIAEVRLVADGEPTSEPVLTDLVETRVGSPLSLSAVRESIVHPRAKTVAGFPQIMPLFEDLDESHVLALMAYLKTLRGEQPQEE